MGALASPCQAGARRLRRAGGWCSVPGAWRWRSPRHGATAHPSEVPQLPVRNWYRRGAGGCLKMASGHPARPAPRCPLATSSVPSLGYQQLRGLPPIPVPPSLCCSGHPPFLAGWERGEFCSRSRRFSSHVPQAHWHGPWGALLQRAPSLARALLSAPVPLPPKAQQPPLSLGRLPQLASCGYRAVLSLMPQSNSGGPDPQRPPHPTPAMHGDISPWGSRCSKP